MRIPVAVIPAHPLLVGDRNMLRKLRAAEMAAWENARPESVGSPNPCSSSVRLNRKPAPVAYRLPLWMLLFLAACGTAAVSFDLQDLSLLLTAWSQLLGGIRSLFA